MKFKKYIENTVLESDGWVKIENIETIDEGLNLTFKKILHSVEEIVNVKYFKEKMIDKISTLLIKIEGSLYQDDIDDLEDKYQNYFFDQDIKHQILQVHEE